MSFAPSAARFWISRHATPVAAGVLLAIFLVGMRWGSIGRFGSDLPVWDQWDAEGLYLLAPWMENRPIWPGVFQAHNEHRVVLTKLTNLALTLANGCWDQRLECVFNALLPAIIAASLFLHGRRFLPAFVLPLVWLVLAAGWGLPLAWQNIVSGFHSQQFFLIALSYGAIACLPLAKPWSKAWWFGAACAVLALGSMASGFFAALVVIGLIGWQLARRETNWARAWPALVVVASVVIVGAATRVSVDYHEGLKAQSVQDFFLTFWRSLQWPLPRPLWLAPLVWTPWAWLAAALWRRPRGTEDRDGLALLGLGGWVLLQLVATAYVRGSGGLAPPSRYVDTLVFGVVINALALGWLTTWRTRSNRIQSVILVTLAAGWLAVVGWGAVHHARTAWPEMIAAAAETRIAETNTRHYLLTNNVRHLETNDIPFPDFNSFIPRISRPSLRALMPASVRPPLEMSAGMQQGFTREQLIAASDAPTVGLPAGTPPILHEPFWSSWDRTGAHNTGEWTSAPLRAKTGWIELRVAGAGGPPGVALEIRDARLGFVLAVVHPPSRPDVWEKTYVRIPDRGFVIAAVDRSASGWIAFSGPVEVPALSYLAIFATRLGWPMAGLALGAALVMLAIILASHFLAGSSPTQP